MYTFAFRTCLTWVLLATVYAALPPYIKVCKRNDPEVSKCILNSIEQLRGKLIIGIPELNVPPIEPFELKHIRLLRGPSNARLDINLTNILVYGPSKFKVRDFKADPDNVVFTYVLHLDQLDFRGRYQIDAQVLLLKLVGEGALTGVFNNYNSDCILQAHKVKRNNDTYIHFEKMKFNIRIGKARIHLDNLFNGDPILGPVSNDVLNANSDLFLDEIKPILQDSVSNLFTNIANRITESFTYNELFPEK